MGPLNRGVKRRLNMLSFYKWERRVIEVCETTYGGCNVRKGSEKYSSMMCTWCNRLHENLGGGRVYRCPFKDCIVSEVPVHRDGGGAQNIKLFSVIYGTFPKEHEVWTDCENMKYVKDDYLNKFEPSRDGTYTARSNL